MYLVPREKGRVPTGGLVDSWIGCGTRSNTMAYIHSSERDGSTPDHLGAGIDAIFLHTHFNAESRYGVFMEKICKIWLDRFHDMHLCRSRRGTFVRCMNHLTGHSNQALAEATERGR